MCGICGKVGFAGDPGAQRELVGRMNQALHHRGPDQEGLWAAPGVVFGHRRLSIIDLAGGRQPMANETGDLRIVFNGEIYNFLELRRELESRGHRLTTNSDTETIIHLYEDHGEKCLDHLRGMFAFALWDGRNRKLFLARDRVGKKPLFYYEKDGALWFASEIKAILQDPEVPRRVNLGALHHYLTYQYVPPPDTMFEGIKKLPPAHWLVWEQGRTRVERYWELRYEPKLAGTEEEILEELRGLLEEAVRIRLISEVPLGAFLSGGMDSSLVVGFMSRLGPNRVKTFSVGFEEQDFNELPYARLVARHFGTHHREFTVRPKALEILPELIWYFDEPFADSSAVPTYYVARITRQFVTVALNGDGGDESFAGYERYLGNRLVENYRRLPRAVREKLVGKAIQRIPALLRRNILLRRLARLNELSLAPREEEYASSMTIFKNQGKLDLYTPDVRRAVESLDSLEYLYRSFRDPHVQHPVDKMMFSDVVTYLPGDLLVKVDRMTMAHSLEGRSPFLDHRLMEFAARIPAELKLRGTTLKYLLKRLGEGFLPPEILQRGKQGFGVPLRYWFRGELIGLVQEVLANPRLVADGFFRQEAIDRLVREHRAGHFDHSHRIWALLNLELWYYLFILRGCAAKPSTLPLEGAAAVAVGGR